MKKEDQKQDNKNKKDAGNNQWTNPSRKSFEDNRERRDGPGGN